MRVHAFPRDNHTADKEIRIISHNYLLIKLAIIPLDYLSYFFVQIHRIFIIFETSFSKKLIDKA